MRLLYRERGLQFDGLGNNDVQEVVLVEKELECQRYQFVREAIIEKRLGRLELKENHECGAWMDAETTEG